MNPVRNEKIGLLNLLFIVQLLVVGLVVTGVLPRLIIPFWVIVLVIYILSAKLEDEVIFFARSIPFFVAIPLAPNFDSLNTWRILSGLIFLKWLVKPGTLKNLLKSFLPFYHDRNKMGVVKFAKNNQVFLLLSAIFVLALLSITQAQSYLLAAKRVIYFVNLSLIGIVAFDLIRKSERFGQRLIKNISIPVIIVTLVGMVQLAMTYFMDIFQFVDFWAKKVELGLFGSAWANIALKANTWFAYYGDQLSLRMFSLFPDSHSFPIFLLLGLPAVFAISFAKLLRGKRGLKSLIFARASIWVLFIPLAFLAAILSGTRGIWLAGLGAAATAFYINFLLKRGFSFLKREFSLKSLEFSLKPLKKDFSEKCQDISSCHDRGKMKCGQDLRDVFLYVSSYLILFFLLFGVAYFIFASDQFQVQKGDAVMFGKRVTSVLDISETSNARRLEIWKASVVSIIKHPLLGVGIGNFPVVVGENLARAKAGSSAHNLYLHIAAEMGVPALFITLWFLWLLLKKTYSNFLVASRQSLVAIYFSSLLIFLPWVLLYSLTDVAIFDERAFLLFVITCALIFGQKENRQGKPGDVY